MQRTVVIVAGLIASAMIVRAASYGHGHTQSRLVAEDASAPLRQIAIHYQPSADVVWKQLFAVLPPGIEVEVEVAQRGDFDRLQHLLAGTPNLDRMHPIVGAPLTNLLQESGDLVATPQFVFADINLTARDRNRSDRQAIEHELHDRFSQTLIWLGDALGDVPRDHIAMYMAPLDDHTIAVGDPRMGAAMLSDPSMVLDDVALQARRFDRAAELLIANGFEVVRVPALVLAGAGSFVTYTNALFDRREDQRIVYLPTYAQPALDNAAQAFYEAHGFEVHRIDVSKIYQLDGSLGGLVNVLARGV